MRSKRRGLLLGNVKISCRYVCSFVFYSPTFIRNGLPIVFATVVSHKYDGMSQFLRVIFATVVSHSSDGINMSFCPSYLRTVMNCNSVI